MSYFLIEDFPDKAATKGRFAKKALLTEREASFIAQRIEADRGDSKPDLLTWVSFKSAISDGKLWIFSLMFMCTAVWVLTPNRLSLIATNELSPAYALAFFGMWDVSRYDFMSDIFQDL